LKAKAKSEGGKEGKRPIPPMGRDCLERKFDIFYNLILIHNLIIKFDHNLQQLY